MKTLILGAGNLLLSDEGFGVVLDELHALVTSKRGDLLSLGLARLWRIAPQVRAIGLSATVAEPDVGARSVPRVRTVVVLPAPFGPRKPNTSP